MALVREIHEVQPVALPPMRYRVTKAFCDACGATCWHAAHERPVAVLSRVQDDGHGNMEIWDLDLCADCKNLVMERLRARAREAGFILPDHRAEVTVS